MAKHVGWVLAVAALQRLDPRNEVTAVSGDGRTTFGLDPPLNSSQIWFQPSTYLQKAQLRWCSGEREHHTLDGSRYLGYLRRFYVLKLGRLLAFT